MTTEQDRKLMILLVDDLPSNIQMLNETLKDGYHLFFATTGKDALRIASEAPPDLILLDIVMPDMDGYEVCKALKSDPLLRDIPVIFITAVCMEADEEIALELGAVDYITKPFNPSIVRLRVRNHIELKRQRDVLSRLSSLDGLTGVPNRRSLDAVMEREWRRGTRSSRPISMVMIDIDFFKPYNDTCGHLAGDDCLKAVAKALQGSLGRAGDLLGRYGGEEFLAVLPDTDREGALAVAQSIHESIAALDIDHPSSPIKRITVSLGVATACARKDQDYSVLLHTADQALYQAKQEGRNRTVVAEPSE